MRTVVRSASKGLGTIVAVLLLLLCWSFGSVSAVGSASSSLCSVSSLPIAATAVSVGEKRVLRAVPVARKDPGLVLLFSPSVVAAAAAAAVAVVVVVVVGLVSLLASPVTRLDSMLVDTVCLLLSNRDWASAGMNQIDEMRIRIQPGAIKNWPGIVDCPGGFVVSRGTYY